MALLSTEQNTQLAAIRDVEKYISASASQSAATPTTKSIISVASTKGSAFTTSSVNYTPMGMFVNVKCPKKCYLWINFYSSSQNTGSPASQQGYSNTYAIFLMRPISRFILKLTIRLRYPQFNCLKYGNTVADGVYTIDIRAKTSEALHLTCPLFKLWQLKDKMQISFLGTVTNLLPVNIQLI
jgi:hypothetical protein